MTKEMPKIKTRNRSRTPESFRQEMKEKNPNIEIVGDYTNTREKVECICKICAYIWNAAPNHLLEGHGCPSCAGTAKKTHKEFIQQMNRLHPDLEVLSKYETAKTKVQIRCKRHNYIFSATPSDILREAVGCKYCKGERIRIARTMPEEVYLRQLSKIGAGAIQLVSPYLKQDATMDFHCTICGTDWKDNGAYILTLSDCPYCSGVRKTDNQIINEIESHHRVTVIDNNVQKDTILVRCNFCGNIYNGNKYILQHGSGCDVCNRKLAGISLTKPKDQFIEEMYFVNPNIRIESQYINAKTPVNCTCLLCFNNWDTLPTNLLRGHGCPSCVSSNMEKNTEMVLQKWKIHYKTQVKFKDLIGLGGGFLSYDFYIPSYHLFVECQGKQHFESIEYFGGEDQFKTRQEHDRRKREYVANHGLNLLEIRYDEDLVVCLDSYFSTHTPIKKYTKIIPKHRIK